MLEWLLDHVDDLKVDFGTEFIIKKILFYESAEDQYKDFTEESVYNHILNQLRPGTKWTEEENKKY
jgi:hypothetical protein